MTWRSLSVRKHCILYNSVTIQDILMQFNIRSRRHVPHARHVPIIPPFLVSKLMLKILVHTITS